MRNPFTPAELEQLLDRPVRHLLTDDDRAQYEGRHLLITGAGGSIGSELARQLADCRPASLTLLERSELHLFEIAREIAERAPGVSVDPVLTDVCDAHALTRTVEFAGPDVVFHAAAYKHVSFMERDVCAAVAVNVLGSAHVAAACRETGARLVLISSDKAATPRSVMGASKRLAELVTLSGARSAPRIRPIVVRFGNVLGSSGSVLAIFRDRIRRGLPLPLTDPTATRYVMTAEEAVALVMKADVLARRPETYWLDMGEPMPIGLLADRLLALEMAAGFPPVAIQIVGLGPGEKRFEELTTQGLRMCPTAHRRIWVARQRPVAVAEIARTVERLRALVADGDAEGVLAALGAAVVDFVPSDEARAQAARRSAAARRVVARKHA
jgi:FlaA1/EpsC-like NDP-sugar epimerase